MTSKSEIDRLGERLKRGQPTEADLALLNDYRQSFLGEHQRVVTTIQQQLHLEPTGRVPKTVPSILAKLRRESIRLSQIQDIAGCRIITPTILDQDRIVDALRNVFDDPSIVDRRAKPNHGYRAVHVIVSVEGR